MFWILSHCADSWVHHSTLRGNHLIHLLVIWILLLYTFPMKESLGKKGDIEKDKKHKRTKGLRRAVKSADLLASIDAEAVKQARKGLKLTLSELITPQSNAEVEVKIMQGYERLLTDVFPPREDGQPLKFSLDTPEQQDAVKSAFQGIFGECLVDSNQHLLVINPEDHTLTNWGPHILRPIQTRLLIASYGLTAEKPLEKEELKAHFGTNDEGLAYLKDSTMYKLRSTPINIAQLSRFIQE